VTRLVVETAAKVNLSLHVFGPRPDGYHDVETVLHTVGLWDRLHLTRLPEAGRIVLEVNAAAVPPDESNLCCRAAALLAKHVRPSSGVAIRLEKAIPVRAGLGGGSSDAAATLVGLARLWACQHEAEALPELAAQIGADVPFFLRGGCCLAQGRGDELSECRDISAWLVLVVPESRLSTREAYETLARSGSAGPRNHRTDEAQGALRAVEEGDVEALAAALHNDFEELDLPAMDRARRAKADIIAAGCLGACLSGSGSAVFGIASNREAAEQAAGLLREKWEWVKAVRTVPPGENILVMDAEER